MLGSLFLLASLRLLRLSVSTGSAASRCLKYFSFLLPVTSVSGSTSSSSFFVCCVFVAHFVVSINSIFNGLKKESM
jgi:hypothetical protein